ncbi:MAG TPA: aminopeptidase P N-terminal domain-containing protein [Luteolibacter sp.]|nr:aminopeptidase P N-terminal domain-containing protein [Luteolibacter sp.]
MRYDTIDSGLFTRNRKRLTELLKPASVVIVHANDIYPTNADGTMPFKQNANLLYLCGIDQEETILLLFPDAQSPRDREILFVKETSEWIAVWEGAKLTKEKAREVSGIERVEWLSEFKGVLTTLIGQADHIYLESNEHNRMSTPVETRNARFIKECQERYPLHRYERLAKLMNQLRVIKDPEEIRLIRKACDITEAGFRRLLGFIKPGVGEWEIEAELIHEFVRRGSRGFAYAPIIGSGIDACVLHYVENNKRCKDGDLVLLDVAAEYMNWNSDLTRTVPINGRFTKRQRDVYDAVLRVLRGANEILRPGNCILDYQKQVIEIMEEELVGLGLFSAKEAKAQGADKALVKKYFMHGTSHHMGLDVHDVWGGPTEKFVEGMVFTIEPGIYIREEGFGVRLEDDYLIGKNANINLMESIPIEAEEIEDLMNANEPVAVGR